MACPVLYDQVEEISAATTRERSKVTFSPKDHDKVVGLMVVIDLYTYEASMVQTLRTICGA